MANENKKPVAAGQPAGNPMTLEESLDQNAGLRQELAAAQAEIASLREMMKPVTRAKGSSIGPVPAAATEEVFVIPMGDPFFAGAMRTFQKLGGAGGEPSAVQRPLGLLLEAGDPLAVPVLQDYLMRCSSVDAKRANEVRAAIERFSPKPNKK